MIEVFVILGSDSDLPYAKKIQTVLKELKISVRSVVASAHRTPNEMVAHLKKAEQDGAKVVIAVAGLAAHLPGVCAAHTILPVIAVPVATGPFSGEDALYSSVMMPPGIPVATVTVGEAGATNAALLAAAILAVDNKTVREALLGYREKMRQKVIEKNENLQKKLLE